MSDSVVKAGATDVLSSVKRLVDEDAHTDSEFIFVPAAKPGRLVLTDALRVSDEPPKRERPAPLKLMPEASVGEAPMRLQPCHAVRPEAEAEPARDLAGSLSAKIEALEAAIARTEDQWEPDGDSDDAYSGTRTRAVEWPTAAAQQATFIRDPEVTAMEHDRIATIDPEELRELVAQIVRDELQGALGERITRNLRKMVRREISRALAGHEAD